MNREGPQEFPNPCGPFFYPRRVFRPIPGSQDFKEAYMTKEFNPDDDTRDDIAEDDLPMNDELTKEYSDLLMF